MPDWSVMKTQTMKQSNRSSRIAGGWKQGSQPAPEKNIVAKSKEAMAGLSEIRRPTKGFKDLRIGS